MLGDYFDNLVQLSVGHAVSPFFDRFKECTKIFQTGFFFRVFRCYAEIDRIGSGHEQRLTNFLRIGNIAASKAVTALLHELGNIEQVSETGKIVKIEDLLSVFNELINQVGAYEAGTAKDC